MSEDKLIPVQDALKIVLSATFHASAEMLPLKNAVGHVLCENIVADRHFPPFDRVMMDGIAVRMSDLDRGVREFTVQGLQAAGDIPMNLGEGDVCLEIMTGAVLPENSDVVIRYEDVKLSDGKAILNVESFRQGQNIHRQGLDQKKGDLLIKAPHTIGSAEVGVLATVGKSEINVLRFPRVLVVSTGDELVEVNQTPLPHQIRRSNVHNLIAVCRQLGIQAESAHLNDDPDSIRTFLKGAVAKYDVWLLSGGVSKGKKDYLPDILEELGIKKHFHRVEQRPGKPFWFGKAADTFVFAFPGNPVSTYMCALKYFIPWLKTSLKTQYEQEYAILEEGFSFKPGLTYFLQVKLENREGKLLATPYAGQGSGDLANLSGSNAFLELPAERSNFEKGEFFPVYRFI